LFLRLPYLGTGITAEHTRDKHGDDRPLHDSSWRLIAS
jgi:hypothetical protein